MTYPWHRTLWSRQEREAAIARLEALIEGQQGHIDTRPLPYWDNRKASGQNKGVEYHGVKTVSNPRFMDHSASKGSK